MITYIAKQDLPGGIIKGDRITNFINHRTHIQIQYDPSKEPKFFNIELPMTYKKGESIVIKKHNTYTTCDHLGNRIYRSKTLFQNNRPYIVHGYKEGMYIIKNDSDKFALFKENYISKYETYYFVNSKGQICNTIVGRDPAADTFRLSIKNYHTSAEDCKVYIKTITSIHK